jgi:hypothetical protein
MGKRCQKRRRTISLSSSFTGGLILRQWVVLNSFKKLISEVGPFSKAIFLFDF